MADVGDGKAEALYRLAPEEFTAARDALVRTLRADGERGRAEEIKKLRRPSAIAWALNQVAWREAGLIESTLAAGSDVRDALERGDGVGMREAERTLRTALDATVDAAGQILGDAGHAVTDDARSRLATTLRAALVDPEVADRVRAGRLDRDVELAGLGLDDVAIAARPGRPSPAPEAAPAGFETTQLDTTEADTSTTAPAEIDDATAVGTAESEQDEAVRRSVAAQTRARARVAELEGVAERLADRAKRLAEAAAQAEAAARRAPGCRQCPGRSNRGKRVGCGGESRLGSSG